MTLLEKVEVGVVRFSTGVGALETWPMRPRRPPTMRGVRCILNFETVSRVKSLAIKLEENLASLYILITVPN